MSSEWRTTTLGECVNFVSGNTPFKGNPAYWGGDIPWISAKDMKSFWVEDAEDKLTQEGTKVASTLVPSGTTLLLTRGMTLHNDIPVVRTRRPATFNQDVKAILPKEGVVHEYVPYLLLGNKSRLQALVDSAGHGTGRLPTDRLKAFSVVCPSITTQKCIASFLSAIDARIVLLREGNATLGAIAQTLFKSWFVNFDPVRSKQEGREPEGIDAITAALFPNAFEDSELGPVPKGWTVGCIGKIAEVTDCLHAKKPELLHCGHPYLQLNNIRDDGLLETSNFAFISQGDYEKWISRIEVREGDCVITNVGRVGAVAQIPSGCRAAIGRNMTAIRLHAQWPYPTYLIELLQSQWMRAEIKRRTDVGTILNALNVRNIPSLRCVLPDEKVLDAYEALCRPLRASMEANLRRSNLLAELRDTLLPRLISGQLRLPEAEEQFYEALTGT